MNVLIGTIVGGMAIAVCEWWRRLSQGDTFEQCVPPWAEELPGIALER